MEGAGAFEAVHGAFGFIVRHLARPPGEGVGEQVGAREHRLALGPMSDRPGGRPIRAAFPDGFRLGLRAGRGIAGTVLSRVFVQSVGDERPGVEAELGRLPLPALAERPLVHVAPVGAGQQRGALG